MTTLQGFVHSDVIRLEKGGISKGPVELAREYPLKLVVNGKELATLVASPHQLDYLVVGFLRLQGFIQRLEDLHMLGICQEQGVAQVRIRGEVPDRLRPTLTTGCGTGISFGLGEGLAETTIDIPTPRFNPEGIFDLFRELYGKAELFRRHGGVHSAAIGNGHSLLLLAEDLGRHNTLDRLAGEALFKGLELRGTMLATSGRISSEMVVKASRLGIDLIASRTAVTSLAVDLATRTGICLVGYVRREVLEIYTHPHCLTLPT